MFVIVNPDASIWWRFKYKFQGREKTLSLGVYPDVLITAAENLRDDYRKLLRNGIDPSAKKQAERNEGKA